MHLINTLMDQSNLPIESILHSLKILKQSSWRRLHFICWAMSAFMIGLSDICFPLGVKRAVVIQLYLIVQLICVDRGQSLACQGLSSMLSTVLILLQSKPHAC